MTDSPTEQSGARTGERIAKLLARAGVASRREVERMIAEGRVRLDGAVVTTPATVLPSLRGITVDGKPVRAAEATRLFLFHKPSGLITAERDPNGKPTIYAALRNALPPGTPRVMPVGRLDLNTEGLLLLTNDGELKRALELPASGVPRTYRARTFGDITQARLEELIEGIEIGGIRYGAIDANMERRTGRNQWIELTLAEGKNREVRRVLEHLGLEVSRLLRTAYGPFHLGDLQRGSAWEVPHKTVEVFRKVLLEGGKALAPVFAPPFEAPARPARMNEPAAPAPARGTRGSARRMGPPAAAGERAQGRPERRGPAPRDGAKADPTARIGKPVARGPRRADDTARTERSARPERTVNPERAARTRRQGEDREVLYTRRSEAGGSREAPGRPRGARKPSRPGPARGPGTTGPGTGPTTGPGRPRGGRRP
jgi:23S rRNA pseudouridine2605 synthase